MKKKNNNNKKKMKKKLRSQEGYSNVLEK